MAPERQLTLDGIRGLAASAVLVSHYLAELPGGIRTFAFGAIAVDVFFVLSGFLIGRLILTRHDAPNFFAVFYIRRILRTVPSYLIVLVSFFIIATALPNWASDSDNVPVWSYYTFTQNFFFSVHGSTGIDWLSPTWTLAVEEQFYVVAPAAIVFIPRRLIIWVAALTFVVSLMYRIHMVAAGLPAVSFLSLLLARADTLAAGVIAAALWFELPRQGRFYRLLEIMPLACLVIILFLSVSYPNDNWKLTYFHSIIAIAASAFILRAAIMPPAVKWLEARWLRFMGDNSYSIYLIHMPVAGIVHYVVTGSAPGITTPSQWLATLLATLATLAIGRMLTRSVEEPLTDLGRRFRWKATSNAAEETLSHLHGRR
ncbi:peptidoglycan/LPS O-acetylase OafA/YrhL [Bosea sp. OAE506]|uniref:acyltransferase family protein n=1 Tax=Bosea sp. OAE506 TaxID=2663870 RepID=UPI00178A746A